MTVITYTRPAKCKDCDNIRYYYKGKRKFHKCIVLDVPVRLNDNICRDNYKCRKEYYPKRLKND